MVQVSDEVVDGVDLVFLPDQLELVSFLKKNETVISGMEMIKRAREMGCLGKRQEEYLLKHKEKIPENWCKYTLLFPDADGLGNPPLQGVDCLVRGSSGWFQLFQLSTHGFEFSQRLVRRRR